MASASEDQTDYVVRMPPLMFLRHFREVFLIMIDQAECGYTSKLMHLVCRCSFFFPLLASTYHYVYWLPVTAHRHYMVLLIT